MCDSLQKEDGITGEDRASLLRQARAVASWILTGRAGEPPRRPHVDGRFGGAFVTFYSGRLLRGCVGSFAATDDLASAIEEITAASLADPRFASNRIDKDELGSLTIEVSVLTEPKPTKNPLALIPGTHGVIIRRGPKSGCFLPKVAAERGWSAEDLLSSCCALKAGLPADAWRDPQTFVYIFTADVFSESGFA